jgi:S-ribosylhomocysteine lyase LuxS involved in autoinducer biosynthesis
VRDTANERVLETVLETLRKIIAHGGEMFGATRKECGNFRELSLDAAKAEAQRYLECLERRSHDFKYPTK